jgi:hypothetical protein
MRQLIASQRSRQTKRAARPAILRSAAHPAADLAWFRRSLAVAAAWFSDFRRTHAIPLDDKLILNSAIANDNYELI